MLKTLEALDPLRNRHKNLIVHTLTTVMKENQDAIFEIYEELKKRFRPDSLSFNYCRGNPLDPEQTEIDLDIYRQLLSRMKDDFLAGELPCSVESAFGPASHVLDQHVRRSIERTVHRARAQFSCVAGRLAGVIYSDGTVVECEVKESKLGNLRDVGYDFPKLWFGSEARQIAKEAADGCYCTHECGHYASTIYSFTKVGAVAIDAARTHLVKKMLTP